MRIIVDGDACPGVSIIENLAKKYEVELLLFCDIHHYIMLDYGEVKVVDSGFQSVDMYVVNIAKTGDIIITQDYGVAAICLPRKCYCINPKGYYYTEKNIDKMLEERHISQKLRKGGFKTSNPKKRTKEDDERLRENLIKLLEK